MSELYKRIITSITLLIIIIISFSNLNLLICLLLVTNFIVLDEFIKIYKRIFNKNFFLQYLTLILTLIYMSYFSLVIFLFMFQSFEINKIKILFLLLICISTDIGGFVFGKTIGGKKITKISPNKTYSGVAGSFLFSIIFGYVFYNEVNDIILLDINIFYFIILLSLLSQIGDLFISVLKRKAKIKDTGTFLPGHGGILDRIDGILLSLPIGVIFIFT
mgnify:CR=1 FL=1